jgi:prevent-host-death family protein
MNVNRVLEIEARLAERTQKRTLSLMQSISATQARTKLYQLIDMVTHEPIQITGKRGHAILISSEDWENIQETLYLQSIPKMAASIKKGMRTPLRKTSKKLKW